MVKYCVDGVHGIPNKDDKSLLDSNSSIDQVECEFVKPKSSGSYWNNPRNKVPLLVVLGICLICIVTSIVTLLILHHNAEMALREANLICFTCHDSSDEDHYHGRFQVVRVDGRCCLDKTQLSQELVGKRRDGHNNRERAKVIPVSLGSHVGAHKHLQINTSPPHSNLPVFGPSPHPLNINKTNQYLEYSNGVELTSEGIRVLHPGLYFVYMSIYFLPNTAQLCGKFEQQTFFGWLHRTNGDRQLNDELLSSEHTCCLDCRVDRETAFTGGVFYLFEGDMIHVSVSSYGVIYVSRDITYMGLSMMGEPIKQQEMTTGEPLKQAQEEMTGETLKQQTQVETTGEPLKQTQVEMTGEPLKQAQEEMTGETLNQQTQVEMTEEPLKQNAQEEMTEEPLKQNAHVEMTGDAVNQQEMTGAPV